MLRSRLVVTIFAAVLYRDVAARPKPSGRQSCMLQLIIPGKRGDNAKEKAQKTDKSHDLGHLRLRFRLRIAVPILEVP